MSRKLITIVVVALAAVVPASAQAYLPPGFIGIAPQHGSNQKDYRLMREAGISSVRLPVNWAGVQKESPRLAEPDWESVDRDVELAAEEGIRVFPVVFGTPGWVAPDPRILPVRSAWQRWAWANFVRSAVHRYGHDGTFWEENPKVAYMPIELWEIWNEQNIVTYMKDPDPVPFATLLRIAGRVLHREDPKAKVIVGGFFGRPLQIPPNVGSATFLAGLYRAGNVKRFFDGVGLHPYVADVKGMGAQLRALRRVMRRHGDGNTPLYVTEIGWGSRSGPTRWERGIYGQANQLSRAFSMLSGKRRQWRLAGAWWYSWTDEGGNCLFCGSAGLLTAKREAKPAWYRFNAWTGGDPEIVPRARVGD